MLVLLKKIEIGSIVKWLLSKNSEVSKKWLSKNPLGFSNFVLIQLSKDWLHLVRKWLNLKKITLLESTPAGDPRPRKLTKLKPVIGQFMTNPRLWLVEKKTGFQVCQVVAGASGHQKCSRTGSRHPDLLPPNFHFHSALGITWVNKKIGNGCYESEMCTNVLTIIYFKKLNFIEN